MKPCELFPDAVVLYNGKPATWFTWDTVDSHDLIQGDIVRDVRTKELTPLPISPAVLRGLGFDRMDRNQTSVYFGGGYRAHYAHQLQAMWLHLNGEELVWNQSEYETALKEELS